jgi:ABC-type lipoprotein release transport system permease subunit
MFIRMILHQARYKWTITLLLWLVMTALVSLYVYLDNSARFSNRSMQLIMKNMGHNLLILPREADAIDVYLCTDKQILFSDEVTRRMARQMQLASRYYASVLQTREIIDGETLFLTGIQPVHRRDETVEKRHIVREIPSGQVRLGEAAARVFGVSEGDDIILHSRTFSVIEVYPSLGTIDDYRIYIPLSECQELLNQPSCINAILSFLCLHGTSQEGVSRYQRQKMQELFPDFKVITQLRIAQGRYLARMTTNRYLFYLLAIVFWITVIVISLTGIQEVSERRREVGILLAMGARYPYIAGLYAVKLLILAVAAALAGFLIGSTLSRELLSEVLTFNTRPVTFIWSQCPRVLGLACLAVGIAAILPIVKLIRMNPNTILTEE